MRSDELQAGSWLLKTGWNKAFRSFFTSWKRTDEPRVWARGLNKIISRITKIPNEKSNHRQKVVMAAGDMFCFCPGALGVQAHGRTSAGRASQEGASGYQRAAAESIAA